MPDEVLSPVQKPFCRFYVVRHGESQSNVMRFIAGHTDPRLTPTGKQQAQKRAPDFKHIQFAEVFSSDLLRAHHTAKILVKHHQLLVKTTDRLRERFYGKYEGSDYDEFNKLLKELMKKYEGLLEAQRRKERLGGEIESEDELFERLQLFVREMSVAYPGKNVMVVCHGGIMREFLIRIGFGSRSELQPGAVKNLGYFIVDCDGTEFFLKKAEGIEKEGVE